MKEIAEKLYILFGLFRMTYTEWLREVWEQDLDQYYCCPGDPMMNKCGCQGVTVREVFNDILYS